MRERSKRNKKNNRRIYMRLSIVLSALFLSLMQQITPVNAEQGRCKGYYEVTVTHISGNKVHNVIEIGEFQGCGTAREAIQARKSAKRAAEECMKAHWEKKKHWFNSNTDNKPYECSDETRIVGYTIKKLRKKINEEIRSSLDPFPCDGKVEVRYSLDAVVEGDIGCGKEQEKTARTNLVTDKRITCECPKPPRLAAPKLITPQQGTIFYHFPRHTLLTWKPVPEANAYVVEVNYDGRIWATEKRSCEATFFGFNFPGQGMGEWRVWAVSQDGKNGTESDWRPFRFAR
ncbi:MAG: hypothetical protein D3924_10795 [Candidatus Electrothrix sp. AR4]|nr:hypothetical protein [Candidatus Electrothrix sp. AR4]